MEQSEARRLWDSAAPGWARWESVMSGWLSQATDALLDMAHVGPGSRVVDLACGAGDQALVAARRVGPSGFVLATDISPVMIEFVAEQARSAGLTNVRDGGRIRQRDRLERLALRCRDLPARAHASARSDGCACGSHALPAAGRLVRCLNL